MLKTFSFNYGLLILDKTLLPFNGNIGASTLGSSAILGDTILSTVSTPLMNPNPNCSASISSQTKQQQIANMMMANLITEQARLFHQYSVSSAAMNYLTNTSTSVVVPSSSLTTAQNTTNCSIPLSSNVPLYGPSKLIENKDNTQGSLKLSDLLNQKPGLDISLRSNEQETTKEEGVISSLIGPITKELNSKHDK